MKLVRTIAMTTDYTYHGSPCEVSAVSLWVDESLSPEQVEIAKEMQEARLRSMRKSVLISDLYDRDVSPKEP